MSFLTPLFLFGAAAVALPIVFHLLRRSARERVPFSSLLFLSPSPPTITRRSRIEHIFLLLVRCLVLLLLAAGFARPFLSGKGGVAPEAAQASQFVVLVDRSASMRREGLWNAALARTERVLRNLGPADEAAVLAFDRHTETVVTFEQWAAATPSERAAVAVGQLRNLTPTWAGTHLGPALTMAAETIEANSQEKEFASRRIILISDLQEGSHLEGLQGYHWPPGVELVLEGVQTDRVTNAGLQLVTESDSLQSGPQTGFRVRVSNAADSRREQFEIVWNAASGGEERVETYVPPGQSRTISVQLPNTGGSIEQLRLSGDEHSFDNLLFHVPTKPEQIKVVYLGPDNEVDPNEPLYYLKRAFQDTRRQSIVVSGHSGGSWAAPDVLSNASLVIIAAALSDDEQIDALRNYIDAGNTVLVLLKNRDMGNSIARLVNATQVPIEEAEGRRYAMLGEIRFEHPLFRPFTDPRYSDFTKIHFWKYRRMDMATLPGAEALARFDNGDPALIELRRGRGNILVLVSGWHPSDSQLALSSKFVPLLYSVLDQAGALKTHRLAYTVGDSVDITATNANSNSVTIRKPDGSEVQWGPQSGPFGDTLVPGIYTAVNGAVTQRFAVNIDPAESKTAPLAIEELERIGLAFPSEKPLSKPEIEQNRRELLAVELEKQQQLWRWLIVAAMVMLLAETWMSARYSRTPA